MFGWLSLSGFGLSLVLRRMPLLTEAGGALLTESGDTLLTEN